MRNVRLYRTRLGFHRFIPVVIAFAAAILANAGHVAAALGVPGSGGLGGWELAIREWRIGRGAFRPHPEIVLVTIEAETPRKLGLPRPVLPLPRNLHSEMVRLLQEAGARALVLDLIFADPAAPDEDQALRDALELSAPLQVTLAVDYDRDQSRADTDARGGFRYWFRRPIVLPEQVSPNVRIASAVAFDPGALLRGAILVQEDAATGDQVPHLALSALLGRYRIKPEEAHLDRRRDKLDAGPFSWPVGADAEVFLHWNPRPHVFQRVEYSAALAGLRSGPEFRKFFHDKIVILGDASGADVHHSPDGQIDGVEFVAHVLNTLLAGAVDRWSVPANAAWGLLLALATAAGIASLQGRLAVGAVVASTAAALLVPQALLKWGAVWVDTASPLLAIAGSSLLSLVVGLRDTARFKPAYVGREAETGEATVMFVDLQRSTAMAERLGALAAQELQSRFLRQLSEIVARHGGDVERTLGDGLMAVFRPRGTAHHAVRAVSSTRALLTAAARMAEDWRERYGVRTGITIGVESGIVAGTMVHAQHEEWSSFGPAVNMAARLQGACGDLGTSVLIGPGARALVQHEIPTVLLGTVALKGFDEPTPVYSTISVLEAAPSGGQA